MDVLSREVRSRDCWELLYADDLVITAKTEEELQARVLEWQSCLEDQGLKMNSEKTEVMVCSKTGEEELQIKDRSSRQLPQVNQFKYLGSVLSEGGGCEREVKERVKAAWSKWREVAGVVCDRRMPRRLKIKIYKTVIRPVLMYGSETWALRKKEQNLLERTEMRMLRWLLGVSLRERIRNEEIRRLAEVACVSEKIREARLRWFGKVVRSDEESAVSRVWKEPVGGKRSRGRQKIRWTDTVSEDLRLKGLGQTEARDRKTWRRKIRCADP